MSSTSPQRLSGTDSTKNSSKSLSSNRARVREVLAKVGQMPLMRMPSLPYSMARQRVSWACAPLEML